MKVFAHKTGKYHKEIGIRFMKTSLSSYKYTIMLNLWFWFIDISFVRG